MPPRAFGGMSVRKACATLNFPNPPTASKDLKKRFITLAKTHHPDLQETEEGKLKATERMASITDAYKLLKSLIENRTAGGRIGGSAQKDKGGQSAAWETDAAGVNFVAPGISKSSGDMWLPWQKAAPSRVIDTEKVLEESTDFWSFKASVRRRENRAAAAEEHVWGSEKGKKDGTAAYANGQGQSATDSGHTTSSAGGSSSDHESGSRSSGSSSVNTSGNNNNDSNGANSGSSNDKSSSSSGFSGSQYSAEHFRRQKDFSDKIKGNSKKTASIDLLVSYLKARAPGRILESIRYIITGK